MVPVRSCGSRPSSPSRRDWGVCEEDGAAFGLNARSAYWLLPAGIRPALNSPP